MPSLWSAVGDEPESTAFRLTGLMTAGGSVIGFTLLPFPALQPEPRNHDCGEQERDHCVRNGGAFAEHAANDGALIRQGCHQMRGVDRAAARHRPDQLERSEERR